MADLGGAGIGAGGAGLGAALVYVAQLLGGSGKKIAAILEGVERLIKEVAELSGRVSEIHKIQTVADPQEPTAKLVQFGTRPREMLKATSDDVKALAEAVDILSRRFEKFAEMLGQLVEAVKAVKNG